MKNLICVTLFIFSLIFFLFLIIIDSASDTRQPRSPTRLGYLIRVGQSLNLTCPGDAVFYQWSLVDQPSQILSEEQFYTIKSATLKDSNRYICHAVHGYGRSSVEMSVRVIGNCL